jgi:hypothetical protein
MGGRAAVKTEEVPELQQGEAALGILLDGKSFQHTAGAVVVLVLRSNVIRQVHRHGGHRMGLLCPKHRRRLPRLWQTASLPCGRA